MKSAVSEVRRRTPSSRLSTPGSRTQWDKKKVGWLASMIWVAWAPASARPMIVTGDLSSSSMAE